MTARTKARAPSRQERALSWRRDQVLECAERVFSDKGFHQATMQEIAAEAEYATGTLYTLFENKDAIFAAVVRRRMSEIDAYVRNAAQGGPPARERIERFVSAFFEFFEAKKHLVQIYVNVTGGLLWNVKAELGEEVAEIHLGLLGFLEGIFRDGSRRGDVRSDLEPRAMAVSLVGILVAVVTDWIAQSPDRSLESRRDVTLELIAALFHAPGEGTKRSPARRATSTPRVPATTEGAKK
jgi:TetR/AcrR family transcriptional regulator